jgi:hypothetical protein
VIQYAGAVVVTRPCIVSGVAHDYVLPPIGLTLSVCLPDPDVRKLLLCWTIAGESLLRSKAMANVERWRQQQAL